ncbi:MAG: HD-GYP domain-containing protein [Gemmatimonadaceae bacterium]
MPSRVYVYVSVVCVAAVVAVWAMAATMPTANAEQLDAAIWFCGLALLGQVLTFGRAQEGIQGTVSSLPALTAAVIAPTWETVSLVTLASLVGELVVRRPPLKLAFNVALGTLSVCGAVLAFSFVSSESAFPFTTRLSLSTAVAFAAASFAQSIINAGLLSGVLATSQQAPLRLTFLSIIRETAASDLLAVPFMFVFARVYAAAGGVGVVVLAVPLVGMRQLFVANWQLKQINQELLELMVAAIEARDPYTSGHSRRVAEYSRIIAQELGLPPKEVDQISKAALLHDVGKMDEKYAPLLRKPARLTPEEERVMQGHAARSAELVAKVSSLKNLVLPVRHHHEAWDGTGYPDGLAGERIPLASRIIAFADTIDAMSSERPYRAGLSASIVRAEIVRCRGTQFDPRLTDQVLSAAVWSKLLPNAEEPEFSRSLTVGRPLLTRIG